MKKIMMIAVLVVSSVTFAQNREPKLEEVDGMIKVTLFHENGGIQQVGFYEEGKLEGKWVSYDQNGAKTAVGIYANGNKVGNWFFWNQNGLLEVDYSNDAILSVKKWTHGSVAFMD
jgi:antitoxin component YwqK of YwqJK toxin-antitoxin module